jgi:hypothetical protein
VFLETMCFHGAFFHGMSGFVKTLGYPPAELHFFAGNRVYHALCVDSGGRELGEAL